MREVKLPSGAVLKVAPAPFSEAKELYQALLRELKTVELKNEIELKEVLKSVFCLGFSSPQIEALVWKCLGRCLYNGEKVTPDTFEPVERRDDYMKVCAEVIKENVFPFVKSLYAEFRTAIEVMQNIQA